jgi:beta-lactamase regulating signal transducer with metallopeptidase domain
VSRWLRRAGGGAGWLLAGAAVAAHATLGVLAVAEYAWLGWLTDTRYDLAAVTLVLASALAGLAAATRVALRAAAGYRGLRRLARDHRRPVPMAVRSAVAALGLAGRVEAVAAAEPFAVTVGLVRPRILVSDQLARALSAAELAAVLAHERCHLRHRDPARLLAARLLAAYGWYIPAARWLAGRVALNRELAADRAALTRAGRGVLAGALLKLAALPGCPAVAAASPAGDPAGSLEARVAQLENDRPARPRLSASRVLATAGGLLVLAAAGLCCVGLSQALPAGVL